MLRLSKLTDYAVVVLAGLDRAERNRRVVAVPEIAAASGLAEPTVAKVLKILGQSGLVVGLRGARGGYRLARGLHEITLAEVVVAFDGPIALTACVDGASGGCECEAMCTVRGRWDPVNNAIRDALAHVTIADLAGPTRCNAAPVLALNA